MSHYHEYAIELDEEYRKWCEKADSLKMRFYGKTLSDIKPGTLLYQRPDGSIDIIKNEEVAISNGLFTDPTNDLLRLAYPECTHKPPTSFERFKLWVHNLFDGKSKS